MSKQIQVNIGDNSYASAVESFFEKTFPIALSINKDNLLEAITEILFGTKEYRLGTIPKPESAVIIRKVILDAINQGEPIPVLVAWGGRKTIGSELMDVAELSAIRRLICVNEFLKKYYQPGLYINIRIEDLGALWLYRNESTIGTNVYNYSHSFANFVKIIRGDNIINPVLEGDLMNHDVYFTRSAEVSDLILDYLIHSELNSNYEDKGSSQWRALEIIGWKGLIPKEQRQYYIDRYKALYPEIDHRQALTMLSDYLAGAKVRYELNGRAAPTPTGSPYIQISFVPPVPGAPQEMFSNTLYYRTVGLSNARTHIAPWRAKGYLEVSGNGEVKTKLCSWSDNEKIGELISGTTLLSDRLGINTAMIQSDILITH